MEDRDTVKDRQQTADHIVLRIKEMLPAALAQYPVDAAYVYGSVSQGKVTPFSDVDVALLLATLLPPYERLRLELAVQGQIEAAGRVPAVDVRVINDAPLTVRGRIVQRGILVYERDRKRRVAFEVATRKRYFDYAPVARRLRDAFLARVHKQGLLYG